MVPKLNYIENDEKLDAPKNAQNDNQNFNIKIEEFFDLCFCEDEYDNYCGGDIILFI
jgi:hypothetical protein